MIPHILVVDDEEDVLESMVPGFVNDLSRRLMADPAIKAANEAAGFPLPASGRLNIKVSPVNYVSAKLDRYRHHSPVHVHLHLCCEKGGSFRHALRLLKEQFCAVVVSDLRFSDDVAGSRAGRLFIEDVQRRNPDTFCVLYSAYQKPDGFPEDRFIRKGAATNLGGDELLEKMVVGVGKFLKSPRIREFARELGRRGLVYQSDAFGATLRRLFDYAQLYFGPETANEEGRRRPRPTLLIDGETGTGKTELAGMLHRISARSDHPFVAATCNQLTDEQFLRSILFGHVKGAFSGAAGDRAGLVQTAGRGVLLLDDLHKLNDGCSVILHSFLDDGEFSHLGEDEIRRVATTAVVCTVETPRWEEIKSEHLLAESFINRVEQLVLKVPPLRSRPEDIEYQTLRYTEGLSKQFGVEMELSPEAVAWLVDHGFPSGNSRKLRDFLKGLIAASARVTDYIDLPELLEHVEEARLIGKPAAPAPESKSSRSPEAPKAASAHIPPVPSEFGIWQSRIARLGAKALADEFSLSTEDAQAACQIMFTSLMPKLWDEISSLSRRANIQRPLDIKLFDELLRYYVIYLTGNPAKAAKQLGMKDNALREFVYSREQKRAIAETSSDDGES